MRKAILTKGSHGRHSFKLGNGVVAAPLLQKMGYLQNCTFLTKPYIFTKCTVLQEMYGFARS